MENSNDNMNDQQFDALLRHAMLEREDLFNEKNTEIMATHTFTSAHADTTGVAEQPRVLSKLIRDFGKKKWNWKLNIFLAAVAITLVVANFFIFRKDNPATTAMTDSAKTAQLVLLEEQAKAKKLEMLNENPLPVTNPLIVALNDSGEQLIPMERPQQAEHHYTMTNIHMEEDLHLHYEDVPTLTEGEKIQTAKDKLKILKEIANPKKKAYSLLPSGKTMVNGVMTNILAFYIQNAEVTNFQYRTFLNDLLVQGRFDDYLKSAPVKGNWTKYKIPEFEEVYFSSPKYNDFPAVNMSREGADMYCQWLSDEMQKAILSKEVKMTGGREGWAPYFRLPANDQWIYAARGGDSTALKFPWGKTIPDSVNNARGCFLCDFNWTVTKDLYEGHHICEGYQKLKQGGFHRNIITTAGLAIDTLLTCPVYSYNPNTTGEYCMLGDVSEMVYSYQNSGDSLVKTPRAMGGNWNSPMKEVQIESSQQYVGVTEASPMIGFRPIFTWYQIKK